MITDLVNQFIIASQKRSSLLKDIKDLENDILSITERIEEIKEDNSIKENERIDAHSRARDKRKRVRAEISEMEHEVRMHEAEISKIKMEIMVRVNDK